MSVEPGATCGNCGRRFPVPREDSTPRKRGQLSIAVPKDAEDGEEILRHLIDMAREKVGRPVGTPPYYILCDALYDYTMEAYRDHVA